jgi:hypothetical protein
MRDALSRKSSGLRMPFPVLILTLGSAEVLNLLRECEDRNDLWTVRVASASAGVAALRSTSFRIVIVSPEIPSEEVSAILAGIRRLRHEPPVLVLRSQVAEALSAWQSYRVAILCCPLTPGLLSRAVDVALGASPKIRSRPRLN